MREGWKETGAAEQRRSIQEDLCVVDVELSLGICGFL